MADYSKLRSFFLIKKSHGFQKSLDLFLSLGHSANIIVLPQEFGNFYNLMNVLHMGGGCIELGGGFTQEEKRGQKTRRKRMWVFVALKFS